MSELISVVVACHNVEEFIEKCIKSIFNNNYKFLEVIAINDNSTDNTLSKLNSLKKKYKQLLIFTNKENKGLGYVRNKGISLAKGKYIGFVDGDDFVEKNFYKTLYEKIRNESSQVSVSDFVFVDDFSRKKSKKEALLPGLKVNKKNILNNNLSASACNKLFLASFLKKYHFIENKLNEDVAIILPMICNCQKISYTNKVNYFYLQRSSSIQNSTFNNKRFDIFDTVDMALHLIQKSSNYEEYKDIIIFQQIFMLFANYIRKEKNFKKRYYFLFNFYQKQKRYDLKKNQTLNIFLKNSSFPKRLFYHLCLFCLDKRLIGLLNLVCSIK